MYWADDSTDKYVSHLAPVNPMEIIRCEFPPAILGYCPSLPGGAANGDPITILLHSSIHGFGILLQN